MTHLGSAWPGVVGPPICAISGMPGIGKTTLAVHLEDVPGLVELRWRSHLMLGGCTDSFGVVRGVRVGVSA
jgi:hypothetical protein